MAKDVGEWAAFNSLRRKLSIPILAKNLIAYTEQPLRLVLSILLLATSATVATVLWMDALSIPIDKTAAAQAQRIGYFTTLWTVQTTLAALVYPIVIALVTIFLQRRPATQALLQIYVIDTGALVAGLSSLTLVVAMSAVYVTLASLYSEVMLAITGVSAVWFLCNAALTTFFLFKSLEFLRPDVQRSSIRRYVANVALPRDVESAHNVNVYSGASIKKWIPVPSTLDEDSEGPQVHMGGWFPAKAEPILTKKLGRPSVLIDIRFWPLHIVLSRWFKEAAKLDRNADANSPFNGGWPVIELPLVINEIHEGQVALARVSSGPGLTWLEKRLLSLCFVFARPVPQRYRVRTVEILDEQVSDVLSAMRSRDISTFERAWEDLVRTHKLLVEASLCPPSEGQKISCALLRTPEHSFFGRSLHEDWLRVYRSAIDAAVNAVGDEQAFFRRLCYFTLGVSSESLRSSPVQIREHMLSFPSALMYELGEWWSFKAGEMGLQEMGDNSFGYLKPPLQALYQSAIISFVGSWESSRRVVADIPDATEDFSWEDARELADLSTEHAFHTARFLLAAVHRGDVEAAEWFADVLAKWFATLHYRHDPVSLYGKTSFVTAHDLTLPWSEVMKALGVTDGELQYEQATPKKLQHAVMIAAIRNFWEDLRIVVIEILLYWAIHEDAESTERSLSLHIAWGAISGRSWRAGGEQADVMSAKPASVYLRRKLRQYASSEGSASHRGKLERLVDSTQNLKSPPMVSGRTYTGIPSDLDSLQEATVVVMVLLSGDAWKIDETTLRQVSAWLTERRSDFDRATRLCENLIQSLRNQDADVRRVIDDLIKRSKRDVVRADYSSNAIAALENANEEIVKIKEAAIEQAQIDRGRLDQIEVAASRKAFSSEAGEFPLHLFAQIEYVNAALEPFTLTLSKVRKGELTARDLEQRAINEEEYWEATMANHVAALVLHDVLRAAQVEDIETPNEQSYWSAIRAQAARMRSRGRLPILILDNGTRPDWVWDWQQSMYRTGAELPEGLRVHRVEGRGKNYVCDFSDIQVFTGPLPPGYSILTSRDLFDTVRFQRFRDQVYVQVNAVENSESRQLTDVKLSISRAATIGDADAYKLKYGQSGDQC